MNNELHKIIEDSMEQLAGKVKFIDSIKAHYIINGFTATESDNKDFYEIITKGKL